MKKQTLFAILVALALPLRSMAQPPEEVPPPPPDSSEAGEVTVAPAPPPSAPAPKPVRVPVVEPKVAAAPDAPEDKTVKGVTISPTLGLYPIGYDGVNIEGSSSSDEGGKTFFRLLPGVGISSAFKTASGKVINFSASYALDWREYYNKGTTKRDFNNGIEGSLGMEITPMLSTAIPVSFDYFYKVGADSEGDNGLYITLGPALNFKANDQLSFKIGYWMYYLNAFDMAIDPSDAPSDIDDLRTGSYVTDAAGIDSFGPSYFDLYSNAGGIPTDSKEAFWVTNSMAVLGTSFKPIDGTSLGFDYRFAFAGASNDDSQVWKGHYFMPKISQDMPWKGGSLSLSDEFRIRKYDTATVAGSTAAVQNFRNRLTFSANQAINDFIGFEAFYRFQISGKNEDDYANPQYRHWFYTGVNFTF